MASVNKVFILGNICKEIECRYTASGTAVASFTVATNDKVKNKSGEWEDKAEFHNVTLWARLAEVAAEYASKGSAIHIEGRLQTRKWEDKEGATRYTTEIVGERMQLLGGKGDSTSRPKGGGSGGAPRDEPMFNDESDIPFLSGPSFYDHR